MVWVTGVSGREENFLTLRATNRTIRPLPDKYRKLASLFGAAAAALGILGLSGWILGMPLLASIRSSYIPMAPITSAALLCLGGLLLVHSKIPPQGRAGIVVAALSLLISAYGLIELVEECRHIVRVSDETNPVA